MPPMSETPNNLHRSIEAAKSLRLELARVLTGAAEMSADDLHALQDTFDGETTLDKEIRSAVLQIEDDGIFVAGCKAREAELNDRRSRFEKRIKATRGLIEQAMTIAEWSKYEMDIGTVTLAKKAPTVEVDDETQIPTQFWKRADPTLDKAGLGKLLKERQKKLDAIANIKSLDDRKAAIDRLEVEFPSIPGAHLETEGKTLTILRS